MLKNFLWAIYQEVWIWRKTLALYREEKERFPNITVFLLACTWVVSECVECCKTTREKRAFVLWGLYALEIARTKGKQKKEARKRVMEMFGDADRIKIMDGLVDRWKEVFKHPAGKVQESRIP